MPSEQRARSFGGASVCLDIFYDLASAANLSSDEIRVPSPAAAQGSAQHPLPQGVLRQVRLR